MLRTRNSECGDSLHRVFVAINVYIIEIIEKGFAWNLNAVNRHEITRNKYDLPL